MVMRPGCHTPAAHDRTAHAGRASAIVLLALVSLLAATGVGAQQRPPVAAPAGIRPADDFSLAFLGMYRKLLEIEGPLRGYAQQYGVDDDTIRAICLFESGANGLLAWPDGRSGYFQLTPATRRRAGGGDDLEAGVRYFAELQKRYGRDDYAVAAFRAGPTNVSRARPMTVETLHYVTAVGSYRNVLRVHEPSLRQHARGLQIERVQAGDVWGTLAARLGVSVVRLRMYNAQLAGRPLAAGSLVAYPSPTPMVQPVFVEDGDRLVYRSRIGDTYDTIATALELSMELLRQTNHLWYQQEIPAGMELEIPLDWTGVSTEHQVEVGETTVAQVAARLETDAWRIIRDNGLLLDDRLAPGMVLRVRREPPAPVETAAAVAHVTHTVEPGDTLAAIARRYSTTVAAIQEANNLGRRTTIRIGQELRIPTMNP